MYDNKYFKPEQTQYLLNKMYEDMGYEAPVPEKTFADCTDDEMISMINAHYEGKININDYWAVGDIRNIQFSGTEATSNIITAHPACDMQIRIIGIEHDNLTTSINGHTKAAITCEFVYSLQNACYIWGKSAKLTDSQVWSNNPRRTWLNNDFKLALPEAIRNEIKTVVKTTKSSHSTKNATDVETTNDDVFLLSVYEVYKDTDSNYNGTTNKIPEGNQYKFYETSSNRIATDYYIDNKSNRAYRWLRSPSSYSYNNGYYWCCMYDNTFANNKDNSFSGGLAPAFCL